MRKGEASFQYHMRHSSTSKDSVRGELGVREGERTAHLTVWSKGTDGGEIGFFLELSHQDIYSLISALESAQRIIEFNAGTR